MKYFFALCCFLAATLLAPAVSAGEWFTDFEKAKAESAKTKRPIYILFTNSDAAVDRSLDRMIFSQKKFQDYAGKKLVLMKVDFPFAAHLQSKSLAQQNKALRAQFGISILPSALLLDANGNVFIDFVKADGSQEKHRRKINEIMDFDPPKRYAEYLDGFVKEYTPPKTETKKEEPATKKPTKKQDKKQDKKPADKQQNANADVVETNIPDENASIPRIPLDPEGNFQDWLKSNQAEEAAEETKEAEEIKEIIEEAKEAIEEAEEAQKKEKPTAEAEKKEDPAPAEK